MSSYGLWLSAAGMKVQEHRQDVFANNMANANTTGFKQDLAIVLQRPVESRESAGGSPFRHDVLDGLAGGLNVKSSFHDFHRGSLESTGKPFDLAIESDGFFAVSNGEETRYTRDGQFVLNTAGELAMTAGNGRWRVLDDGGSPIVLDLAAGEITITADGVIRQNREQVARFGLMDTDDRQSLVKAGENLFKAGEVPMRSVEGRFAPQTRESSNVNVMKGLVSMIEASRAYQLNANLIQLQDQITGQAVNTVGRGK